MSAKQNKRMMMIAGMLGLLFVAAALILYALKQNINLFYTPTQIANQEAPYEQVIRVGGMVVEGSVLRQEGLHVQFTLTDFGRYLNVSYNGILPDLFREGQGIVALGTLNAKGEFVASEVLAKHDENYMPPELKNMKQERA